MAKKRSSGGKAIKTTGKEVGSIEEFTKKRFSIHDLRNITPKTPRQRRFFQSCLAEDVPVILQLGSAGTGKTFSALYCALVGVLTKDSPYEKIVIVRSAVQAREIGFLKGDEDEKNEVYEAPYVAICDELLKYKSNNYRNLKERGTIQFETTSFLRGLTFDNTIILVDEVQSMTYHELSTVMTRVGVNSRILFSGDFKQSDLHRKNDKSGLQPFINVLMRMPAHFVHLIEYTPEDIVRSGIVKEFLLAEESLERRVNE